MRESAAVAVAGSSRAVRRSRAMSRGSSRAVHRRTTRNRTTQNCVSPNRTTQSCMSPNRTPHRHMNPRPCGQHHTSQHHTSQHCAGQWDTFPAADSRPWSPGPGCAPSSESRPIDAPDAFHLGRVTIPAREAGAQAFQGLGPRDKTSCDPFASSPSSTRLATRYRKPPAPPTSK